MQGGPRVETAPSPGLPWRAAHSPASSATLSTLSSGSSPGSSPGATPGPSSYFLTNLLTLPHADPSRAPLPSPLTVPLSEALSHPSSPSVSGAPPQERRPASTSNAELHLSEQERALLRQQLREVLRAPNGRQNR